MSRIEAISRVGQHFHAGEFMNELGRRVAYRTESQNPRRADALRAYLEEELQPAFSELGFSTRLIESPTGKSPFLLAEYRENPSASTVLMYGHGDVVDGMEGEWQRDLDPWRTTKIGDRVYGRGTADNKGQHSINLSALRAVHHARGGRLGFNAKFIVEMGEEIGSPDLKQVCDAMRDELAADLFSGVRRAASGGRSSDPVSRLPRGIAASSRCRSARGFAPFRQLGRTSRQSRDDSERSDRLAGRRPGTAADR